MERETQVIEAGSMQDVCLFAHYDKDDKVDEYVVRYLKKIKELHFSIIFISTARLAEADVERLRGDCSDVILRENTGLDFGSWAAALAKHGSDIQHRLLLANDSVYGPIGNLATALDRMTRKPADFYGLVESFEISPHLQSWFLLFEPWVARHAAFRAILNQPFAEMTKTQIIENGEVDLSHRLVDAGFRYRALYMINEAGLTARRYAVNPMLLLWRELLFEGGVPFLKISLLRDNPLGVENSETILQTVEQFDPQSCDLIKSHLARTGARDSPRLNARQSWIIDYRYMMLRNGYRLNNQKRRMAEMSNYLRLLFFMAAVHTWTFLRHFRRGWARIGQR